MSNSSDQGVCIRCGEPVDLSDCCWLHRDDCPKHDDPEAICTCHLVAHPEHCPDPDCNAGNAEVEAES